MSGELLVAVRNKEPRFEITKSSIRQVLEFVDSKQNNTIEFSSSGKRLFAFPYRMARDSENSIYVIDTINKDIHGRIVAVDRESMLRFTYNGYKKSLSVCSEEYYRDNV